MTSYACGCNAPRQAQPYFCDIPARNARLDWSHEEISHGPRFRVILQNVLPKTVKDMKDGGK